MASITIHQGPYEKIPSSASPGLLFLRELLPSLDALEKPKIPLRDFLSSETTFTTNANPPNPVAQVLPMFVKRSEKLAKFHHDVHTAWDIANADGSRTIIYESTSTTVFKKDPEAREAKVKEFSTVELKPVGDGKFVAVEIRTVLDTAPLTALGAAVVAANK